MTEPETSDRNAPGGIPLGGSAAVTSPKMPSPVARIAPSPSGRMHAGNVFAALMSWLIAKREGGRVILRIEDLDPGRSRPQFCDLILKDLEWLGITWDGPVVYQSGRSDIYAAAVSLLGERGLSYPCFCSRADLHASSAPHTADGTLIYPGTCRNLTDEERAIRAVKRHPALRLMVPPEGSDAGTVCFHDMLQGSVECDLAQAVGDFIVQRSDGAYAYQLAVVVDDLLQGVNLTVRGCDLLPSTPQQLYLRRLLVEGGLAGNASPEAARGEGPSLLPAPEPAPEPVPEKDLRFCHIPILVNGLGKRLSKRDGDCDMGLMRERYRRPDALIGHMAHVTGIVAGKEEPMTAEALLDRFSLEPLKMRWAIEWER